MDLRSSGINTPLSITCHCGRSVPIPNIITIGSEQKEAALAKLKSKYDMKHAEMQGRLDTLQEMCNRFIDRPTKETHIIGNSGMIAIDGSTISIEYHACLELQQAIDNEPEESESFGKIAKDKAMGIIGGATEDVAKGLVKEAGKKIVDLGIMMGPVLMKTAAFAFFKSMLG